MQDLMATLEAVLKDVERVTVKFSPEVPENEYEMKSQLELCKVSQGTHHLPIIPLLVKVEGETHENIGVNSLYF